MPTISRFYGILVQMYYDDHNPPHIHVIYGEWKAVISIIDFSILRGGLPPRATGLIMEWMSLHKIELIKDWELAFSRQVLFQIDPLR